MTLIGEIMNQGVVAIRPETTLAEAVKILTEHNIGGAPVVSAEGALLGMITELALFDVVFDPAAKDAPVADCMTADVQVVHPQDPPSRAAQLFALYSYRRLPVVDNGAVVGMITRRDLMNHALRSGEPLTEPLVELIPELAQIT
jgi:tRNA nucleotidyltransferase (CCA-adding enzyme)